MTGVTGRQNMPIPEGEEYVKVLEEIILRRRKNLALGPYLENVENLVAARHEHGATAARLKAVEEMFDSGMAHRAAAKFPELVEWMRRCSETLTPRTFNALLQDVKDPNRVYFWGAHPTVIDLATKSQVDIDRIPLIGRRALRDWGECLGFNGLRFGMTREEAEAAYRESGQ